MNIIVKGRNYFEDMCGSDKEAEIMITHRVISVNSVRIHEDPPFSQVYWHADNVLVLNFDDVDPDDYTNPNEMRSVKTNLPPYRFMTEEDATAIVRFVKTPDLRPIIVHCTAGISRSGAIGLVLNEYYNRKHAPDDCAHERFFRLHTYISPNIHVMRLLWKRLGLDEPL